ncbi:MULTISPECIES: CHAD domain-containing protein [unclassified Bradyrhizobium]|uniref:CYTH and CHAD domain-containing protein n=1 Tax=unclassified Bradyrhizobium TaxID=2631580 RepID=UPI002916B8A0|nr:MULTISPECIES: CHAD domain-containing protein [unclassified Bradyrhizobium]
MPDSDATASVRDSLRAAPGPDSPPRPNGAAADTDIAAVKQDNTATAAAATDTTTPDAATSPTSTDVVRPNVVAPGSEIELKLLVDADQLAGFNNAAIIAAHARNRGARKHLKSVYYDTPERTLWRNGLSLRVRQSGARFVQTVKAQRTGDPLRRAEWEAAVPSLAPDLALATPLIPEELREELQAAPLETVFVTDVHRHQRIIELPSGTVEIAFDRGALIAGERSLPVSEIELELKSGSTAAIYEIALRLAEHDRLRPSIRSKSARGYDLAADEPPGAEKPRKLHFDPAVSLDETFAIILRGCFHHLLQAVPAAEDGRDPEGVHQLRVSLRRLRAALHLMHAVGGNGRLAGLLADARWLAQSLSAARDWDVFQTSTLPAIAENCPTVAGFDSLRELAERQRSLGYRKLRHALSERRCAIFLLGLGEWIESRGWRSDVSPETLGQLAEPAIGFAGHILSERHQKLLKRGRHFKSLPPEQRHRVRLALKKLRYSVDFLLPFFAERKATKKYSEKLAGLQEQLGHYNDMAVTAGLLSGLGMESTDGAIAAAAITGWQAHAMLGVEGPLRKAWRSFKHATTPWSDDAAS